MNPKDRRRFIHLAFFGVVALAAKAFSKHDLTAAALLGVLSVAGWLVVRKRSRRRIAVVALTSVVAAVLAAGIGSASVALWNGPATRHVILRPPGSVAIPAHGRAGPEAMGFILSESPGALLAVQDFAPDLSTIAATSLQLGPAAGTVLRGSTTSILPVAHAAGASGMVVLQNYDGYGFNGGRAEALMRDPAASKKLATTLSSLIFREGWDGIVLDLEALAPSVRALYPVLVQEIASALPGKRIVVAVPASPNGAGDAASFDLRRLSRVADGIVLMAYEEHNAHSAPGPVAGWPWVTASLHRALTEVPASKLILGIPSYGYVWHRNGTANDVGYTDVEKLSSSPGAVRTFDRVQKEWKLTLRDGSQAWYADPQTVRLRAQLAIARHLAGIAVWQIGAAAPAMATSLPFTPAKHQIVSAFDQVEARGLVALTFDDGPDPRWTPEILSILEEKHVPATFFVVGSRAMAHPEVLRAEIAAGEVVGNHTWSHMDISGVPTWLAGAQISGDGSLIESLTGRRPRLFRFPYGAEVDQRGTGGGDVDRGSLVQHLGMSVVGWNDDTLDWTKPGAGVILARALEGLRNNTIILMHDAGGNRSETVAALPMLIDRLRTLGYSFTTPDRMTLAIPSPYIARTTAAARMRFLVFASLLRLWIAIWTLVHALLLAGAGIVALRLVWVLPAAFAEAIKNRRRRRSNAMPDLAVSVIVPAHNEGRVIQKTLTSLGSLSWPNLEIVVVDDGSTDDTFAVASRFPVRVVRQRRAGKAAALNAGIRAATGDVICVLDADTLIRPDFLIQAMPHFSRPGVVAVAGNVKVGNRRNLLTRLQALEYIVGLSLDRRAQSALNTMSVVPGAAGLFRRNALVEAGGYPHRTMVEDADLTITLLRRGGRIVYEPNAVVYTEAPETLRAVARQRRRWSYGTIQVVEHHAPAFLAKDQGRTGFLTLPWLAAYQVFVPVTGAIVDLWLFCTIAFSSRRLLALAVLGIMMLLEIVLVWIGLRVEREDMGLLPYALGLRLVWRPIQVYAATRSAIRWIQARSYNWHTLARNDTVPLEVVKTSSSVH